MKKLFSLALATILAMSIMAETKTLYCKCTQSWWTTANAAIGVYAFGDSQSNAQWPGERMTAVEGEDGMWKYELANAEDYTHVIFVRVNASGAIADWGAKTADLTLPTDEKNLYTITSTSAVWGNPGVTGTWSVYGGEDPEPEPEPVVNNAWKIVGTFNNWNTTLGMDTVAEGVVEQELTLEAGREYEMKLHIGGTSTYMGNNGTMTQAHCTAWTLSETAGNIGLITTIAGTYRFHYDIEQKKLTVTYPAKEGAELYETAVRSENTDVMIQAYYWSHGRDASGNDDGSDLNLGYGEVTWNALDAQAKDLTDNFDLIWLAPSQKTADWTGFIPVNYSDQNSRAWGTKEELKQLIGDLHKGGAKVVADIVINHAIADEKRDEGWEGTPTEFCQFEEHNFGAYGVFNPDWSWVSKTDEMYLSYDERGTSVIDRATPNNINCGGAHYQDEALQPDEYDCSIYQNGSWGTYYWSRGEYDFRIGRDWSHKKREVREMSRAYLTWMRDEIGYDGFRYDFCKGFHTSHINDYNRAAAPYFSVMEVFEGDINKIKGVLHDAGDNSSIFDFPTKFQIKEAVGNYNLPMLKNQHPYMLIGEAKYRKNAVVFCENHDSFREDYNLAGTPDATRETLLTQKRYVLQANAFVLTMPGVPCVFFPHWKTFTAEINAMIAARKAAGVHSESNYQDWAGSGKMGDNWYAAQTEGKNGYMYVKLGVDCNPKDKPYAAPDGREWICAYADDEVGVYYTTSEEEPAPEPVVEVTQDTTMYIAGNFTNWADGMQTLPYTVENAAIDSVLIFKLVRVVTTTTTTTTDNAGGEPNIDITIVKDTAWYGQPYDNAMTRDNNAWVLDGDNNVSLVADAQGDYVFSYDEATNVLSVEFPGKPITTDCSTKETEMQARKVIRKNHLYIQTGNRTYTATGQAVQ